MAAQQPSGSSSAAKEYVVRLPKDHKKKYSIMKFSPADKVDFVNATNVQIERENNLKDYKAAYNVDVMPKFGAGSEFGRDQKEEARRKKYGIMRKKYNPYDQPWVLRMGKSKTDKKYKGSKSVGMLENAKYYIFTQHADKAFEAYPIEEWFDFNPVSKFKSLDAEEAEEQFSKRDKTLNYFSIMVKKRIKGDDATEDEDDPSEKKTKGKKKKDFKLSDMDDWDGVSDEASEPSDSDEEEMKKKKKKDSDDEDELAKKTKGKKGKKSFKRNSEDEAMEESDEADEGEEVDYMSDSTSDDEDPYEEKDREEDVYNDKGVDQEDGLNKMINSDDEDEEVKNENEDEDDDVKEDKIKGSDSESSGSSDSDSDIEKDPSINSALFLQKKPIKRERKPSLSSEGSGATNSRSATPTIAVKEEGKPRSATSSPAPKKARTETPPASNNITSTGELSMQETVRRYLMRKPMTTKDILQKIKSKNTGVPKEKLVTTLTQILKKLNPDAKKIQDKLYLSLKKTD